MEKYFISSTIWGLLNKIPKPDAPKKNNSVKIKPKIDKEKYVWNINGFFSSSFNNGKKQLTLIGMPNDKTGTRVLNNIHTCL